VEETGSLPASIANGNALHRLFLLWSAPPPAYTNCLVRVRYVSRNGLGPAHLRGSSVNLVPVPGRTLHGSTFGTTDQVTGDVE